MNRSTVLKSFVAGVVFTFLVIGSARFLSPAATAAPDDGDAYRVELVSNDQYKIQSALNTLEKQGWNYVSCVERADKKVVLIFRRVE